MTVTESTPTLKDGRVVAIAGPVVDVEFPPDAVPAINPALPFEIVIAGQPQEVRAAVAQPIGHSPVPAICLRPPARLIPGPTVPHTRPALPLPVGRPRLGPRHTTPPTHPASLL